MIRLITWPFRAVFHLSVKCFTVCLRLCRAIILYVSAAVFVVVFGVVMWGMVDFFNNAPGKVSLSAAEMTFGLIFGALPWWGIACLIGAAGYLWARHKVLGSAVLAAVAAVVLAMVVL